MQGTWKVYRKTLLVNIQKDKNSEGLFFGDRILFLASPKELPEPVTPYSFDYRKYLRMRGIWMQAFIKKSHWRMIPGGKKIYPQLIALHLRNTLLDIFRNNGITGQEFAVGSALLLGYTDEIDPGIMRDYSATGAMHILSVSGMHVGMIFLVLESLLKFLRRFKYGMIIKAFLIIVFIWFYALITGLSPCVMRAAVMISLIAVSKAIQRTSEILNPLLVSLLFLLVLDPNFLMDTGFQLSYLAISGIIFLFKPISDLYSPSTWLGGQAWGIIAVSMAAQIGTFPLSIYYFHQFPNYFMLTNIIVIPLSNLIIYAGILLLAIGSFPVISIFAGKVLTALIWSLNSIIHLIEELPFSTTKGLFISVAELYLLYGIIIGVGLFLFSKRRSYFFGTLGLFIILSGLGLSRKIEILYRNHMIIYRFRETSVVELVHQGKGILFGNNILHISDYSAEAIQNMRNVWGYKETLKFLVHPDLKNNQSIITGHFFRRGNFIQFGRTRIVIINSDINIKGMKKVHAEILLVTDNPRINILQLLEGYSCRQIIIDRSTPKWKRIKWKKEAEKLGISYYSLDDSGTCIMHL